MWIVKLGGSLSMDPVLPEWLDLLTSLGGGRVTVVCGGGTFADEVRRIQGHWEFGDLAAHNMAVLAMVQLAYQFHALNPMLQLTTSKAEIRRVLHRGKTAVWLPFELQRDKLEADTNWDATSDSIALDLARKLNAERLVLVKSCLVDPQLTMSQLGETGVVDRRFASLAGSAAFPIEILNKGELGRMRNLLLGDARSEAL